MAHPVLVRLHRAALAVGEMGLSLFFPPTCVGCGRIGELFCAACAQAVEATPHPQCATCGQYQPVATAACPNCLRQGDRSLRLTRAAGLHTAPLREAIHAFKYEAQTALAPLLARYLVAVYAEPPWSTLATGSALPQAITAVVPVPLHKERLAERGYNQSELLAAHFCRVVGLPLQPAWLARVRETRQQVGLAPGERQSNVAGAFAASGDVAGQSLLLIDDVYTTGATLRACAQAARAAGAHAVYGLTLARPAPRATSVTPGAPGSDAGEL
jgi:ComF family protein